MARTVDLTKPTGQQRHRAAVLGRMNDLQYEFVERLQDGTAIFRGVMDYVTHHLVAVNSDGKVALAASRTYPDNDPPFALIIPIDDGHGAAEAPDDRPRWADEDNAMRFLKGEDPA
jgi:hypothetical protein